MLFYDGSLFPDKYRNAAFVAFHGSLFVADSVEGRMWKIRYTGNGETPGEGGGNR